MPEVRPRVDGNDSTLMELPDSFQVEDIVSNQHLELVVVQELLRVLIGEFIAHSIGREVKLFLQLVLNRHPPKHI